MGRPKRKTLAMVPIRPAAPIDEAAALDDRAVDAILDAFHNYDGGDPIVGIGIAIVGGLCLWAVIGSVFLLLT